MSRGQVGDRERSRVGEILAGRFRVLAPLGHGGMAEVYEAVDTATRETVAVKVLRADLAENREAVERFRREGEVLTGLRHPTIVEVKTYGALDDGSLFLVMELLRGETLGQRMRRGRMEPAELGPVVAAVSAGMTAAHEAGVVHRDLKPDNIFLTSVGDDLRIKILDFGISKIYGSDKLTQTGEVLGTPRYMAPEQLSADERLDRRVDVYAFGVILYEALAGTPPFPSLHPSELILDILHGRAVALRTYRPDLSKELEGVVMRSMSKVPEARYATHRDLAQAFLKAIGVGRSGPRPAVEASAPTHVLGQMGSATAASGAPPENKSTLAIGTFSRLVEGSGRMAGSDDPSATDRAQPVELSGAPPAEAARVFPKTEQLGGVAAAPSRAWHEEAPVARVHTPSGPIGAVAAELGTVSVKRISPGEALRSARARASADAGGPKELSWSEAARSKSQSIARTESASSSSGFDHPTTEAYTLPVARARFWLIGIVSGALFAALILVLVRALGGDQASKNDSVPPAPASAISSPNPNGDRHKSSIAPAPIGEAAPPVDAAVALQEPVLSAPTGSGEEASADHPRANAKRPRKRHAPRAMEVNRRQVPGREKSSEHNAASLVRSARAALRSGNGTLCLQLIEKAYERGAPASTLRLEGDCLLRVGRQRQAKEAYERFCRLLPDHPAITEVRGIVEGLGGRCG